MGFLVHQHQHSHKHKLIIEQANCGLAALHSVLLHRVEDTENVQEEVDNIQVEVNGGQDVLLRRELLHQHAGVIDDEATEDQGPSSSQEQTCIITVEEELQREQSTRGFKVTDSHRFAFKAKPPLLCVHLKLLFNTIIPDVLVIRLL